ncbi:MAG: hypothetical protein ACRBBW_09585 [Cellvibrionaceae bacterium]
MKYSVARLLPIVRGLSVALMLALVSSYSHAQVIDPEPCHVERAQAVNFTGDDGGDLITVKVSGNPCSQAIVSIVLSRADGEEVYRYEGNFIEHMPYIIYEPELNSLVEFFVSKVIDGAILRQTGDLPPYTGVDSFYESTNDFVVIDIEEYEKLRQGGLPLLWHATGESTWVHVVYNPSTQLSQVIMRGGVFQ